MIFERRSPENIRSGSPAPQKIPWWRECGYFSGPFSRSLLQVPVLRGLLTVQNGHKRFRFCSPEGLSAFHFCLVRREGKRPAAVLLWRKGGFLGAYAEISAASQDLPGDFKKLSVYSPLEMPGGFSAKNLLPGRSEIRQICGNLPGTGNHSPFPATKIQRRPKLFSRKSSYGMIFS